MNLPKSFLKKLFIQLRSLHGDAVCLEESIENCNLKLSCLKLTEEDTQENYSEVKIYQPDISKYNTELSDNTSS